MSRWCIFCLHHSVHVAKQPFSITELLHFHFFLIAGVVGAPQMTSHFSFLHFFLCFSLPSGTWRTVHSLLSSHLFYCLPRLPSSFAVPCEMVLARPDGRETCPYRFSLRVFTIVRKSSCGPIACWILAQTYSLVTWLLYEMRSILR